jgi:lactaldehyde reductase
MIEKHLPAAVDTSSDIDARHGMAVAQYITGMGFSNFGLGFAN